MAQQRAGNIYGTVTDAEGNPLPGVSVTLTGTTIGAIAAQTSVEGKFRFLSLFPGNDYVLKFELQGFKARTETGVIVNIGRNADLTIKMEQGTLEEQVTVVATTPIVDTKRTQVTHTVTQEMLQSLPSGRDPWVIMAMVPSIQLDRENIGGVEGGQQPGYYAKGSSTQEWTMDGMQVTDKSSWSSPGYWDFDSFEELNISTATMDVEHRDPGIVINIVTRRGRNKLSLGGRFFYTNQYLQGKRSQELLDDLRIRGYNRADDIKDFGFNAGGPFLKDKAWWWIGYGIQQIKTINARNVHDDTYLNNYNGKINLQLIPSNRMEFLYSAADKTKFGRDSSEYFPPGYRQGSKSHFGNPTIKFQDEQTVSSNLFVSARVGKVFGGFGMRPESDLDYAKPVTVDIAKNVADSVGWFYSDRPHFYGVLQAQYFKDKIMGTAHEIKVGIELNNNEGIWTSANPGNLWVNYNYNYPVLDYRGQGQEIPPSNMKQLGTYRSVIEGTSGTKRISGYISDVITIGRFNLNLGLRFDRNKDYSPVQTARSVWLPDDPIPSPGYANNAAVDQLIMTDDVIASIRQLMPDQLRPSVTAQKLYTMLSPRIGLTYDLFGNGKTILKASYSLYPGYGLGTQFWEPYGLGGWMNYWWWDVNTNGQASKDELYWINTNSQTQAIYNVFDPITGNFIGNTTREEGNMWGGFTWGSPTLSAPTSHVDTNTWKTDLTHEIGISVDREIMKNFGVSLNFTWKRMGRFSWWLNEYFTDYDGNTLATPYIQNTGDYEVKGVVPNALNADGTSVSPGEAAGKEWWGIKPYIGSDDEWNGNYTFYSPDWLYTNRPSNNYNTYYGADLVFTKRLSNKWMFNGSLTYQTQKQHLGTAWLEPTNNWANDGQIYPFWMGGGSGKISQPFFTRWLVKLSGLYQLPFDINIAGTFSAHEGVYNENTFQVVNLSLPSTGGQDYTIPTSKYNNQPRLPSTVVINLKIEKMFRMTDTGRMYFSVDCFNVTNVATILRRYGTSLGSFYFTGAPHSETPSDYVVPYGNSGRNNELMNPIVFRLGMRFQF